MYKVSPAQTYFIAVYESRNHAMQMYHYFKSTHPNKYLLISTPCRIKSGCSYSIKFNEQDDLKLLLDESANLKKNISGIYLVEKINGRNSYKKVAIT
ncbi:DUF3343 domain-containing protein [Serpentinicella alkaliphila]|uniref:Uncharacterized protein DUF3343 n=1 Tax=Serpentinicella alkaliphila TaxID=1734049 RepID=A0A4R2THE4_9FIRM|nr:DUF3343 domain-containing protein [Serpentinicella alkaliphila]QUH26700.1 DUF3343 domain-containing protein [Serpentinicella alkaliphila]TCP96618.1 uncharacterized protein DUF3343 [Serpentinicella alkaliphila]